MNPSLLITSSLNGALNNAAQEETSLSKNSRKRGVVLTWQGRQKLQQAGVLNDDFGRRYTHEELSERSLLDARTVSRVLGCEVKVDKGTLKTFFRAFNLQLEPGDYAQFGGTPHSVTKTNPPTMLNQPEASYSLDEIIKLKQQILGELNRLFDLLGDELVNENARN